MSCLNARYMNYTLNESIIYSLLKLYVEVLYDSILLFGEIRWYFHDIQKLIH